MDYMRNQKLTINAFFEHLLALANKMCISHQHIDDYRQCISELEDMIFKQLNQEVSYLESKWKMYFEQIYGTC